MKSCPFCKEQVNDEAIKCRYCQSMLLSLQGADLKSGELWVAFVREANINPKIDLTLEIKGVGKWTWKGLDADAKWEAAAKGPDPKK